MPENTIRKYHLKDIAFINDFFERCHLAIYLNGNSFAFALLDDDLNKFMRFDSYQKEDADSKSISLHNGFEDALQETGYADQSFKSVKVLVENPYSTLVPNEQFDATRLKEYLTFTHHPLENPGHVINHNPVSVIEAHSIFLYPAAITSVLKKHFRSFKIYHQSCVMISAIMALKNSKIGKQVYVNLRSHSGDILFLDDGRLRFFNSFSFEKNTDFVFFVLESLQRLNLDPEFIRVILLGNIVARDEMYQELYRFIKNLGFISRNSHFQYSPVLDSLPSHLFFNLFSIPKCE
ncbi:MAG: DUF3822 family protein [Bacteroidetes bacterium]|nr:DUF3822 family protein [Bacteroidota bacterium]